ncbi:hypothetical protein AKH17_02030 [Pelagibacteraceae bacterium GOM-A2]|nr:hypothetical protein AKH17_02030 [Pelagibacteraceae bacterium GOM-A2]|tara:strand:- start:77 stop:532 length:456 start_codon:yes stop_codon:yes gene_type:complete
MKYIFLFFFIFIINCTGNKVSNYHGTKKLDTAYKNIKLNESNKNDLIRLMGPPSTVSDFDKNKWLYIERLKTTQSIIKLGKQKLMKSNVLIVELNNKGILINKKLLNLENMNDIKYLEDTTEKDFKNNNFMYGVLTSLREKINAPAKNRRK